MNIAASFAGFTYKVKALFKTTKKPTARVYEHVPKFETQNSKNASKTPTKTSPKKSPNTSRKRSEPARPGEQRTYVTYFNTFKESLAKLVSGADSEQEEFVKPTKGRSESKGRKENTATSPTAAAKTNRQSSYDVEASGVDTGEDDLDSKEDTKLLQEDDDDGEVFNEETKGTTSSLQAGWNISNLIQG